MLKRLKKFFSAQLNNEGSSMVVVIIAMGFIGILASILMYMSMMNYQMKMNNLQAKDNFYSAETVLDEIRAGMQEEVSDAVSKAYRQVLVNFDNTTVEEKEHKMRYLFFKELETAFAAGGDVTTYDMCKLYDYLEKTTATFRDGKYTQGAMLETTYSGLKYRVLKNGSGSYVDEYENVIAEAKGKMERMEGAIVLRGIKVTYIDADGYVSVIETDIRMNMPDLQFVQAVTLPTLTNFSMVAQENIEVIPVVASERTLASTNHIAGSFYGKRLLVGNNGEEGNLEAEAPLVTLQLQEPVGEENNGKRMVIAEDIFLNEGTKLLTDEYGELWADSIVMNGAHKTNAEQASMVDFQGNDVYLADDVMIQGKKNYLKAGAVSAEGKYMGKFICYGAGNDANSNSSIIVNGTDTELHFEELTNLTLAGNAYIGLSDVNANLSEDAGVVNPTIVPDVPMGQSVAVKSDQIAYLVPAECLGISSVTGDAVESHITNPMTIETYKEMLAHENLIEVSNNIACNVLGGKTLADYGLDTTGAQPMYQKYFKRISSEITLVYYYVMFDSTDDASMRYANQYFQDYYRVNKVTLDAYNKLYTDNIQIRDSATGFYTLHLAGNVVRYDAADTLSIKEATAIYDDSNANFQNQLLSNESKFVALSKKMIDVYELLSAGEKADSANVYTNLVDVAMLSAFVADAQAEGDFGTLDTETGSNVYYFGDGTRKAAVVDGDYTYNPSVGGDAFSGIILATGNVTVRRDFEGVIISGGTITLDREVDVKPHKEAVLETLVSSKQEGTNKYYVTDFLLGGEGYLSEEAEGYLKSDVNLGDLITYENWQKQ